MLISAGDTAISSDDFLPSNSQQAPRVPVIVAVSITVSWIFICAALFNIWEHDWTYAESCYFMFISMSTIGLGDLAVQRRDLMVMCFIFVITGLSMVSMCINVIQASLEELYIKILMKLLTEYHSKLLQGDDRVGASMGMMQMWGKNKAAKFLMPLLSKEKLKSAMVRVQEDAEACGIDIPPIFSDIDDETGMPKLFNYNAGSTIDSLDVNIQNLINRAESERRLSNLTQQSPPSIILYDMLTQTDAQQFEDKDDQTSVVLVSEIGTITERIINQWVDSETQFDTPEMCDESLQTTVIEVQDNECSTDRTPIIESSSQTGEISCSNEEAQTHLFDVIENNAQTEIFEFKNQSLQTMLPELIDSEAQIDEALEDEKMSRISKARKRLRKAFSRGMDFSRRSSGTMSRMWSKLDSDGELVDEKTGEQSEDEESPTPSLNWDPVDGMHAEKQRPVKDLARFFEVKIKRSSLK